MAELLLMQKVFARISGKESVDLKGLFEALYDPILEPYTGDFESFKNIFYRLNQEGVVKSRLEGTVLFIESIKPGSPVHEAIDTLFLACAECPTVEEFERRVHTSGLNRHFMDDEEIKAVYFQVESERGRAEHAASKAPRAATRATDAGPRGAAAPTEPPAPTPEKSRDDPLSKPVVVSEAEKAKEAGKIEEMRGIFEKKVDKLKAMTKDYVESLLGKQNEMDLVVLRFLLNDLLPLRDLNLDTDALIQEAVRERGLPFALDGTVYKRQGQLIKIAGPEIAFAERTMLQRFGLILSRGLMDARFLGMPDLQRMLDEEEFAIPEGETLETLLEKTIRQGFFKGYVDLVEQRVYRAKTEEEQYQEQFLKDLNKMAKEIASDAKKLEDLKKSESKIPAGLEILLLSPEKRGITGVLDKAEAVSQNIQDFVMEQVQVGKKVSVADLSKRLKDHVHRDHVDVPYPIDEDAVERILEKLVEDRKIAGFFEDQSTFIRKR
ncbi:MAG: hypothetical protein JW839_07230 [Candidatus Lokiarchaeota archaeon]|nr:hypothetical protein [Candidatus Lokiarchaeota archaeon]